MKTKFLRRDSKRYSKLGKGRKKQQTWRKPTGRDNKMREKRGGYPAVVSIGYKKSEKLRDKSIVVKNIKDLDGIKKDEKVIMGKVGKKKKIEIAKKAMEKKLNIQNLNIVKFLKDLEKKKAGGKQNESK
ncbi:MAG TPA: 50S ribosomal protein L32e [Candidatus Pacearchaeota archaeon]|nr:50S ribosomal protein L32e [archaeon BMS3Abin17]HDK42262.1 50S ribosomal protein L32e [Candidatus Pacearchaeota archaeon]HDZ60406.1 50S ribosomal protein L32e [Candidatus Pacearchaeota archaeon]